MLRTKADEELFRLINESACIVVRAGNILVNFTIDGIHLEQKLVRLNVLEEEIKQVLQGILEKIKTRFILPIDKEDILKLVQGLTKVLYSIADTFHQLSLYQLGKPDERFRAMVKALYTSLACQQTAILLIDKIEFNQRRILAYCDKLGRVEKGQYNLYCYAMISLLNKHHNSYSTIKKREIYKGIIRIQKQVFKVTEILTLFCIKYA